MPDASTHPAVEYEFSHPHGSFAVPCRQLDGEALAHQLLAAEESYITVAVAPAADDLPLVLRLVELGEQLTNGIAKLTQLERERSRLELQAAHDALLERGYGILVGAMDRAVIRSPGASPWTDYARVIGVVVHGTGEVAATLCLPEGRVLDRDRGELAPARVVSLVD
jgi:hypothetical protein